MMFMEMFEIINFQVEYILVDYKLCKYQQHISKYDLQSKIDTIVVLLL